MRMAVSLDETPVVRSAEQLENLWLQDLTTLGLGVAAVTSYMGRTDGLQQHVPDALQIIYNSAAHPIIGVIAARMALRITKNCSPRVQAAAATGFTTVANFGVETAQVFKEHLDPSAKFWTLHNLPDTGRDYLFALGGMTLIFAENKIISSFRRRKATRIAL